MTHNATNKHLEKTRRAAEQKAALRKQAEEQARIMEPTVLSVQTPEEIRETLHELRVQQIELEIENEELRRAQVEIEAGRDRYYDLYDLAPVGYCTLSEHGLILEANLAAATLLGMPRSLLNQQPISRFILKEDQDIYCLHQKMLLETLSTGSGQAGEPRKCDLRLVKPDGSLIWAHMKATVAKAEDGAPLFRVVLSDISERKQAEQTLLERELLLTAFASSLPNISFILDEDGKYLEIFGSQELLLYASSEKLLGCYLHDIFMKEIADEFLGKVKRTIENKEPQIFEYKLDLQDGETWFDARTSLMQEQINGKATIVWLAFDITERKRAEQALRESEERFRHLVHHLNSGVVVHAPDTQIILANEQAATILGISIDQVEGKTAIDPAWRFVREDESILPLEEYPVQRVFAKRQPVGDLVIGIDRPITRDRVWVIVNAFPEFDAQGRLHQAVVTFIDITERKQAEAERERLHAQLSQIQKAESLGCMAGAIAHIFNNQLYIVIANLDMAIADLPRDVKPATLLTAAKQGALKAAQVSGLMLSYLGQSTGLHVPLDLSESCRQSLSSLQDETSHGPFLKVNLPSPGPTVKANANQIQQMLANLVTNAREAIGEKEGTVTLTVKTVAQTDISKVHRYPVNWQARNTSYACLEVTDTGCGIANEAIDNVFDPFFSTKFTGRGLGLPVVYGTVRSHKGVITVASDEHGSTFRVFLPLSAEEIARQPGRTPQPFAGEGSGTVLLIEDEEIVRNMAKAMIMRLGYTVLAAKDGIEAMEMFARHQDEIRCVFSDMTMPRMNGLETLAALRKLSPGIPVILCSGYDEAQVLIGDHSECPQVFLRKPYQMVELQAALAKVMEN